jgi:small nuclear ribonucleoprotein (snRNP)-like protein
MENVKGPLALLSKFKVNKTRVKIYVRKEHGVRGFITGIIEAFDKHLNIALVDCIEQWKRRKYKFSENKVAMLGEPKDCSELLARMRIEIPKIITKSIDRKNVQCTRKIAQLMVRGEEVILIGEDKDEGCRGY